MIVPICQSGSAQDGDVAHFHPLRWEIDMSSYASAALDSDPVVQAVFVHEYVHYVQSLTGTIGRHILLELVRLSILAGLSKQYGWPPPAAPAQIDLEAILAAATKQDFAGSEPQRQYFEFCTELAFALEDKPVLAPAGSAVGEFVLQPLTVGPNSVASFVHVVAQHAGRKVAVPVTDRVVFENMARQVQRNFLRFNNNLVTSPVDDYRALPDGDLPYVCLHEALKQRLPTSEDCARWTITLCQIALSCRNPGMAFEHMAGQLTGGRSSDLPAFVQALNRDMWFLGEFDQPPVQQFLNDLIQKWGTAMRIPENWELREFTQLIANACNAVRGEFSLMAGSLLAWKDVGYWIKRFGCPPLVMRDETRTEIQGVPTSAPWTRYLRKLVDLMS